MRYLTAAIAALMLAALALVLAAAADAQQASGVDAGRQQTAAATRLRLTVLGD